MIHLSEMSMEDFTQYLEKSTAHYAEELINSGVCTKEDALKISKDTFNKVLPDGLKTTGHNLMNLINETKEKIGYIWFGPKANSDEHEAFIYDFEIYEQNRSKGYGKSALPLVHQTAKEQGFNKISLHVFGHNKAAIRLYEKMGYEAFSIKMAKKL